MIEKEQQLLAQVLDLFAQKFNKKAILRGGMVLRVLGSPRLTNDLDYVFVPYKCVHSPLFISIQSPPSDHSCR